MADFFSKPKVNSPVRGTQFDYNAPEVRLRTPPDVSAETIRDTTVNNPVRQGLVTTINLQRKLRKLRKKIKGTIDYHVADLNLDLGVAPDNILQAIEELGGPLTPERFQCYIQLAQDDTEIQKFNDSMAAPDDQDDSLINFIMQMLERMTQKKHTFGLEFLFRLLRLCLAYAVHMIIGGLCSWFMGKLNIPIPFLGSLPLGTMIATQILAPQEKIAKQALGFPCDINIPQPKFCFDFFTKDQDAHNLLPCCIPAGMSAAQLRIAEMIEKLRGGSTGTQISDFLKVWKVEGGLKDGYVKVGNLKTTTNTDLSGLLDSSQDGSGKGIKAAFAAMKQSQDDQNKASKAVATDALLKASSSAQDIQDRVLGAASSAIQNAVDSWFTCIAQALSGTLHDEPENPYQGPPCLNPDAPTNKSSIHREMAQQVVQHVIQQNSVSPKPGPTQAGNILNLVSAFKRTEHLDTNLQEIKNFLKTDGDIVNPATKRCIEESSSFKFGGPDKFSLANTVYNPKEFFAKLGTDNKIQGASDIPGADETLTIGGGDIIDQINNATEDLTGAAGAKVGDFMNKVLGTLEETVNEMDRYTSSVNATTKFFSSKEFCCVVYLVVLIGNVARGKAICPTDDISKFFKYANKFQDKKDVASLKIQLAFLKQIIDAARNALAVGVDIKGLKLPLKDLMEQVRTTVSTITKMLIDMATEPIEKSLDQVLLNPEINALVQANCFYAFDFFSIIKCAIEWFKLKLNQIAMDLFQNNFQNITLMKNIRIGGMRLKVLDLLSNLLGQLIDILLGIGDCYDPDDYMKSIVSKSLQEQYSDAERVYAILDRANVTPKEVDEWSKTIDGEDPLNIDPSAESSKDIFADFPMPILTENTVRLLRSTTPLALFSDSTQSRRLVNYDEFVKRIEDFTGTTVSQVYIDLFSIDDGIFNIFKGKVA